MSKVEDRLREWFPDQKPRDAMKMLMYDRRMGFTRISRVLRVSSERVWRYAQSQGLLKPKESPYGKFDNLLRVLRMHPGHTPREQLQNLRARWGSWKKVSSVLGFSKHHVEKYRILIGLVVTQNRVKKGSWRRKYEQAHGKGSIPERSPYGGRETDED